MIYIHYNNTSGEIIEAYHDSCTDIPTPNIAVDDAGWYEAVRYQSRKIDITTLKLTYDKETEDRVNTAATQIAKIDAQLEAIEAKTYRPLREIQLGLDADGLALAKLTEYNGQIAPLRAQRAELTAQISS